VGLQIYGDHSRSFPRNNQTFLCRNSLSIVTYITENDNFMPICQTYAYAFRRLIMSKSYLCLRSFSYYHVIECDYRRVLDWRPDLLGSLTHNSWLHFKVHYYTHTHTSVHSHVFTSRCSVAASNGGPAPSSGFQNYARTSATSFPHQQLTTTEPQQSSNSLTHLPIN
jgi:hypothetical protein